MSDMSPEYPPRHQRQRDRRTIVAFTVAGVVAAGLLAYAVPASYESLSRLAAANGLPFARFYPAGLDGGLIGLIVMDLALTWARLPIRSLHLLARVFGLATIAANAWAGWPDTVAVFLRVFAPMLIVIVSEVTRYALLRQLREEKGEGDPVPFSRWLLAFPSTWRLWRRMKLWRITSYAVAVDMELSRLHAIERLRERFGERWEKDAPGSLVWMLTAGVRMGEALALVAQLCAVPKPQPQPHAARARKAASRTRNRTAVPQDVDTQAEALRILSDEPGISGSELGRRLGKTEGYGRILKQKLAAAAPVTGPIQRVEG
jgi:Protein of unknown function (DUF2637)